MKSRGVENEQLFEVVNGIAYEKKIEGCAHESFVLNLKWLNEWLVIHSYDFLIILLCDSQRRTINPSEQV